jgi:hypothetical protein
MVAPVVLLARWMREHVPEPMIDERHLGTWSPAEGPGEVEFGIERAPNAFGYDVHRGALSVRDIQGLPDTDGAWRYRSLAPLRLMLELPSSRWRSPWPIRTAHIWTSSRSKACCRRFISSDTTRAG